MQSDSALKSNTYHIPFCRIEQARQRMDSVYQPLKLEDVRSGSVSGPTFEELFNHDMLGSRWLTYEELRRLHDKHRILDASEHFIIHTQEFGPEV